MDQTTIETEKAEEVGVEIVDGGEPAEIVDPATATATKAKTNKNWFVIHTYSGYENKV